MTAKRNRLVKLLITFSLVIAILCLSCGCNADSKTSKKASDRPDEVSKSPENSKPTSIPLPEIVEKTGDERVIADFSNSSNLQRDLDEILKEYSDMTITYENPVLDSNCQRRNISITCKVDSEEAAKEIISELNSLEYGCYIGDVTLTYDEENNVIMTLSTSVFEFDPPEGYEDVPNPYYQTCLSEEEQKTVDRVELLTMLDTALRLDTALGTDADNVTSVTVKGNTVSVELTVVSLDWTGVLQENLEKQDMVMDNGVFLQTASTSKGKGETPTVTFTIELMAPQF